MTPDAFASAAVGLAEETGWRLFRADPRYKRPMHRGWQTDAASDPDTLARWFAPGPARVAAAAVTGEAFDVFDIEADHVAAVRAAIAAHPAPWVPCPIARTGRGGVHLYVRATGLRNRNLYLDGVHIGETRGVGGLVIVPPSRSRYGPYSWAVAPADAPLAPPHPALLAMYPTDPTPAPPRPAWSGLSAGGMERTLFRLGDGLAGQPEGNRNAYLNWAAWTAVRNGIPADVAGPYLADVARSIGLPDAETRATVRSATGWAGPTDG